MQYKYIVVCKTLSGATVVFGTNVDYIHNWKPVMAKTEVTNYLREKWHAARNLKDNTVKQMAEFPFEDYPYFTYMDD